MYSSKNVDVRATLRLFKLCNRIRRQVNDTVISKTTYWSGAFLVSCSIAIALQLYMQAAIRQSQRQAPGGCVGSTLCGRLGQALRSDAYVGFREGPLTLVNIAEVSG